VENSRPLPQHRMSSRGGAHWQHVAGLLPWRYPGGH
jgi:hypothetical protein